MTTVQMAVSQRRWVLLSISYCVIYFVTIRSQYFDFSFGTSGNILLGTGIEYWRLHCLWTWFIRYIYYWNLHFLNNVIINKTKVLLPQAYVTLADYYLAFQSFDFVRTWWRLFQVYKLRMLNWFSPGTSVSFTNKTDRHDITEILLKVALNTITITLNPS
jgi:hypothetical protein